MPTPIFAVRVVAGQGFDPRIVSFPSGRPPLGRGSGGDCTKVLRYSETGSHKRFDNTVNCCLKYISGLETGKSSGRRSDRHVRSGSVTRGVVTVNVRRGR